MLEIVVLKKYLIRGLDKCYALSKVKEGRIAEVLYKPQEKKVNGFNQIVDTPDYSNFGDETYPSTLARCFDIILDEEVRYSNIKGDDIQAMIQIKSLIEETKLSIDTIARVLKYTEK